MGKNISNHESPYIYDTSSSFSYKIHGDPLHKSPDELINFYIENTKSGYLKSEVTTSAGDYALVDTAQDSIKIITSPSFAGGYIQNKSGVTVGRTLRSVLDGMPVNQIEISSPHLEHYLENSITSLFPVSTIFDGITRVPPGCEVTIQDSGDIQLDCYIQRGETSHKTLGQALENALSPLSNAEKKVTLMYSGGADSTAIYYALREVLEEDDLRIAAVDIGPNTNSVSRAKGIGEKLNISIDMVDYGWPPTDESVIELIEEQMSNDLVNPLNPHWAFYTEERPQHVLTGQNMDAMLTIDMHRPQVSYATHLRSTGDFSGTLKQWASNFQFTSQYENNKLLQNIFARVAPRLVNGIMSGKSGEDGYYLGLLIFGHPNLVKNDYSIGSSELDKLREAGALNTRKLNYLQYQHNAAKCIGTFASSSTDVHLPSMWGPMTTYCIDKQIGVRDAFSPKKEIYNYIHQRSGIKYKKIAFDSSEHYLDTIETSTQYQNDMNSKILDRNQANLDPDKSVLVEFLTEERKSIIDELDEINGLIGSGLTKSQIEKSYRILNIELILRSCT